MTHASKRSEPWRIFLAEDNQGDVWLVQEALRRQAIEFSLDHHATVEDAIRGARECGSNGAPVPHIILLDYNLPRGHGGDILAAVGENPRLAGVPKVILTSFLRPAELQEARRLGANCVITKPASLNEFLSEVGGKVVELVRSHSQTGTSVIGGAATS